MKPKLASNRSPNWAFCERFEVPNYDTDGNYLIRWRLIQTPLFGIYLHRFEGPDPRPTLHDHPWPFVSFVLRGGYDEMRRHSHDYTPADYYASKRRVRRVNVMRLKHLHYISRLHRVPSWTLMFVGRRQRVWGYLDQDGTWTAFDEHPYNDEFIAALARRKP